MIRVVDGTIVSAGSPCTMFQTVSKSVALFFVSTVPTAPPTGTPGPAGPVAPVAPAGPGPPGGPCGPAGPGPPVEYGRADQAVLPSPAFHLSVSVSRPGSP